MIDFTQPGIENFRKKLIAEIPCADPNSRATLERLALPEVLRAYLNWKDRFVAARPRKLCFSSSFDREKAKTYSGFKVLCGLCVEGGDLTPYLSGRIHSHGYSNRQEGKCRGIEWGDKDYALSAFGVHHLHVNPQGRRSSSLFFVRFSREQACFIFLGDHGSFDDNSLFQAVAKANAESGDVLIGLTPGDEELDSTDRNNLQRHGFSTVHAVGNHVVCVAYLSLDGTSPHINSHIMRYLWNLETFMNNEDKHSIASIIRRERKIEIDEILVTPYNNGCDLGVMEWNSRTLMPLSQWLR